jgi:hypothetical protein
MRAKYRVATVGSALVAVSITRVPTGHGNSAVSDLMHRVVNPPLVALFAVGWVSPDSDGEWTVLLDSAARLTDAAKALSAHAPAANNVHWLLCTPALRDAASRAGATTQSKNLEAARRASAAVD